MSYSRPVALCAARDIQLTSIMLRQHINRHVHGTACWSPAIEYWNIMPDYWLLHFLLLSRQQYYEDFISIERKLIFPAFKQFLWPFLFHPIHMFSINFPKTSYTWQWQIFFIVKVFDHYLEMSCFFFSTCFTWLHAFRAFVTAHSQGFFMCQDYNRGCELLHSNSLTLLKQQLLGHLKRNNQVHGNQSA